MKVFYGFDSLPRFTHPVVTVGSYDGVHVGHRKLLGCIRQMASRCGSESVVVTFSPHPREILGNRGEAVELLTTLREKILLLDRLGIDNLIIVAFTEEFSRMSSYDFVRKFLVDKVGTDTLVIGFNHHFGYNHLGDFQYLQKMQSELGFSVYQIPEQDIEEHKVSSTIIRNLIRAGEMSEAAQYLGGNYFIILDDGMAVESSKLLPPEGKYGAAICNTESYSTELSNMVDVVVEVTPDRKLLFYPPYNQQGEFIVKFQNLKT